jgi:hypothetical protein
MLLVGSVRCGGVPAPPVAAVKDVVRAPDTAQTFLLKLTRPWPPESGALELALTNAQSGRVSSYDNALLALYYIRNGRREDAGRILAALATLQHEDGAIPFSFPWPRPEPNTFYVRSGATAWVGYAAVEYLDADSAGPARPEITKMAHLIAHYLLEHQLAHPGDPRDGLVLGGEGTFRLEVASGRVVERFVPGAVVWAATEHNIDAYFFLRDFGALTGDTRFSLAAERIRAALLERGWMADAGQFVRGYQETELDRAYALDCASWGALFFLAAGDTLRAETSLGSAEFRYLSRDPAHATSGHRPYAHAPVIESRALAQFLNNTLSATNWDELDGVWAEGSAGVALAALRLGRRQRAEEILASLERVRDVGGGLPTFTSEIPFDFDVQPSIAGTVWVELVRYELTRPEGHQTLWRAK